MLFLESVIDGPVAVGGKWPRVGVMADPGYALGSRSGFLARVERKSPAARYRAGLLGPIVWVSSSGSLAMSAATPRASSRVSKRSAARQPLLLEIDVPLSVHSHAIAQQTALRRQRR
jgi:hypothetical protein